MGEIDLIFKHFPSLSKKQKEQIGMLESLYREWNSKINVISRKDMDSFYVHHVLHSMSIAKICHFEKGQDVADVGCGGGFPSIPLAILYPEVHFTAVDSIAKKISVVKAVSEALELENITAYASRIEAIDKQFDFIVSRAVTNMPDFVKFVWGKLRKGHKANLPNGILYLKGGDMTEELERTHLLWHRIAIKDLFDDEYFTTKEIVYTEKK